MLVVELVEELVVVVSVDVLVDVLVVVGLVSVDELVEELVVVGLVSVDVLELVVVVVEDVVVVDVVGVRTVMLPFTVKILEAIFSDFSPEAERSLISTGITVPGLASLSIVYLSSTTVAPSAAECLSPLLSKNMILILSSLFNTLPLE